MEGLPVVHCSSFLKGGCRNLNLKLRGFKSFYNLSLGGSRAQYVLWSGTTTLKLKPLSVSSEELGQFEGRGGWAILKKTARDQQQQLYWAALRSPK